MRVKVLLALAITSVLLFSGVGLASAQTCDSVDGIPTEEQLVAMANDQVSAYGFPDLDGINAEAIELQNEAALDDCLDSCGLEAPICGVYGDCPDCSVTGTTTIFGGPDVDLTCPIVNVKTEPVCLESPVIRPSFPSICVKPEATIVVPQVNLGLNCYDITCCPIEPVDPVWSM